MADMQLYSEDSDRISWKRREGMYVPWESPKLLSLYPIKAT